MHPDTTLRTRLEGDGEVISGEGTEGELGRRTSRAQALRQGWGCAYLTLQPVRNMVYNMSPGRPLGGRVSRACL